MRIMNHRGVQCVESEDYRINVLKKVFDSGFTTFYRSAL